MNPDFSDMLSALSAEGVEYLRRRDLADAE
jgi:hypothetical protein